MHRTRIKEIRCILADELVADKMITSVCLISFFFFFFIVNNFSFSKWNTPNSTKETYLICFYRAFAIRLQSDVSVGSWFASLIRLARVGTKQHTAEVGYFWLISTLHPHTSWHSCIRLSLPSREQAEEKDEQQQQQGKKERQLCGSLWEMGRDDKSLFEEKSSIIFTEGRFFSTVGETCYFDKKQLATKKKSCWRRFSFKYISII